MNEWSSGYVSDIGYTFGYYRELNPLQVKLAMLNVGLEYPDVGTACELGFGQGLGLNLHAAASDIKWTGTDFNPAQASFAQDLAKISGSGLETSDESFEDYLNRPDLPNYDYIGLHGIWSWVSDENRKIIVEFIRRKLRVGGILYISYNTLPGWATFAPVRHLMTEHASVLGAEGTGTVSRVDEALKFTDRLFKTNPLFSRANTSVVERLKKVEEQDRHYLAHEYFNKDWHPMHFATMAEWLAPAKLEYACSAEYLSHIDAINLSEEQQKFLNEVPDVNFRESVRDFMVNQQFRKDYWVKGKRRMPELERAEELRKQRVVLIVNRADIKLEVTGSIGKADLTESIYVPILDLLESNMIMSIGEIESALAGKSIQFTQILQAVMVLAGASHLAAVNSEESIKRARKSTEKVNSHLMKVARSNGDSSYLASPVTGGGIAVDRFKQLFILAIHNGKKTPQEWSDFAWQILSVQGVKLIIDGKTIETDEENIALLLNKATEFESKNLKLLKALQIVL